jgi:hypothetical protein
MCDQHHSVTLNLALQEDHVKLANAPTLLSDHTDTRNKRKTLNS